MKKRRTKNADIVPERSALSVHYKTPFGSYKQIFDELLKNKVISTRGQRADGVHFDELVFDVNSAYFHNHGGYAYTKQFYANAYKTAVNIVGGEEFTSNRRGIKKTVYLWTFCINRLIISSVRL